MSKMKIAMMIGIVALPVVFFFDDIKQAIQPSEEISYQKVKGDNKKKKDKNNNKETGNADVTIVNQWDLPAVLLEISGLSSIDDNRFACVQYEQGTIFIYNTGTKKIEKQIPFAGVGDYEGIAVVGESIYVATADGKIFEVTNYNSGKPDVKEYKTHLTVKNNVEGLTYDSKNNRLLVAIKDQETNGADYKGIYSFELSNKTMAQEPVYKIDMSDPLLSGTKKKKSGNTIQPSEILINPVTNEILVLDGPGGRLIVLDANGKIIKLHQLGKAFSQPEGMTFTPGGKFYISNEGKKDPGNILEVELNN
jgi:uncharacterized protein YjiK